MEQAVKDAAAQARDADARPLSQRHPPTPADRYQELFVDVQMSRVFDDSKTFVDCLPRSDPAQILDRYRVVQAQPGFCLKDFVHQHFVLEELEYRPYVTDRTRSLRQHIDGLWDVLTRHPAEHPPLSSLLRLPRRYVVPGGRFRELYYWDSYFTMLGLASSGRDDLVLDMAENFAYLIDVYGHVPNGNRSYYLSRSQPPVFALMVDLLAERGIGRALDYLPQLRREYAYWMDGAETLVPGQAHRQLVCLADGLCLNRYWDDRDTPREEAFAEDVATARRSARPAAEVYRELRAGAASGWDFSSRWLADPTDLASIRVTGLLPVDLNALLCRLEALIAELSAASGQHAVAVDFARRARQRADALRSRFWSEEQNAFFDLDWQHGRLSRALTAATVMPLLAGAASPDQARRLAATVARRLLKEGGLATTEVGHGEQWDRPNGWAPLQWMARQGLARYGETALAADISQRWLASVASLYEREGKLVEKYVLRHTEDGAVGGGGGEYPLQDGFGWTNGVTRRLLDEHPDHPAHQSRAVPAAS